MAGSGDPALQLVASRRLCFLHLDPEAVRLSPTPQTETTWSMVQGRWSKLPLHAFTLIEVLAALAIFAVSGLVLASAYVNVLTAEHAALRRDEFAPNYRLVREALATEPDRKKVEAWNELPLPEDWTAHWHATVTATTVADLFDVTLEVELSNARGEKLPAHVEVCRLLRPTWSQPADRETLRAAARSRLAQRTYQ